MIKDLIKLANHLDTKGLRKEADYLDSVIKKISEEYRRMQMGLSWPGLGVSGDNASDIMNQLNNGPTKRGGEVWVKLSGLGPKMVDRVPQHNTLIYNVNNGAVSLASVEPSNDPELSAAAENIVTVFQDAKNKPGPYGELIFSEGINVTITLSTKRLNLE